MSSVLLATCVDVPHGDEDAEALGAALARLDVRARWGAWTDADVDWDDDLVVLRSTWDYAGRRDQFISWVSALRRVANAADVVRWNIDKAYLHDLSGAGVPTVPTSVVAPGRPVECPDSGEFVVKPSVGAGSRGAGRFTRDRADEAAAHAKALHKAGRTVLVQPYLRDIDATGETALIYIDGRFSHAVGKGAMLPAGLVHPIDGYELYVEERIEARTPDPRELEVANAALTAVRDRFGADQLYARVDLLPSAGGPS